jgi:hypothetical protein
MQVARKRVGIEITTSNEIGPSVTSGHGFPPGPVPLKQRVGASRSLGPDRRAIGVPGGFDYLLGKGTFQVTRDSVPVPIVAHRQPAFRSKYEDGIRDVRLLYPAEFYDRVTRLPRLPLPLLERDESNGC